MAFEDRRILFIASGLLLICSVFYITANALPQWGKKTVGPVSTTLGLWAVCGSDGTISGCTSSFLILSSGRHNMMMAARAFVTLSCILSPISAVCVLAILFIGEDLKKKIATLAKILSFASLIGGILGMALGITYAMEKNESGIGFDIGASSILSIVAVVFNLFGMIATLIIK